MASKRNSFLLYIDSLDVLDDLSDEQAGKLFKAIRAHQKGVDLDIDPLIKIAMSPFKAQFARDTEKYEKICNRNRNNGLNGGRPKNPEEPKEPSGLFGNPSEPKKADSDSDSDSEKNKNIDRSSASISKKNSAKQELISDTFEHWWKLFPTKLGKKKASSIWNNICKKKTEDQIADLTDAISVNIVDQIEKEVFGFDRLHPTTYLNQERWNDELPS